MKKILLVEDDDFTRALVTDSLQNQGMHVVSTASVSAALQQIDDVDPHVVVTDLNFGMGPDGADLLTQVVEQRPWTGMVVMTTHASPELALHGTSRIPDSAVYIVKADIPKIEKLVEAIHESIERTGSFENSIPDLTGKYQISATQAEVLRLLAYGMSNASIAKARNISLRAAEALIQRTFVALSIKGDPDMNSRLLAVQMWQQGKVIVK